MADYTKEWGAEIRAVIPEARKLLDTFARIDVDSTANRLLITVNATNDNEYVGASQLRKETVLGILAMFGSLKEWLDTPLWAGDETEGVPSGPTPNRVIRERFE